MTPLLDLEFVHLLGLPRKPLAAWGTLWACTIEVQSHPIIIESVCILLSSMQHLAFGAFEYLEEPELGPEAPHDYSNKHLASTAKIQSKVFAFHRPSQSKYTEKNVVNIH